MRAGTDRSTDAQAISPKLLGVLALTIVVALFGAWRLMADETTGDVGFDGAESLPIAVPAAPTIVLEPAEDIPLGRNPFVRSLSGSDTFTPTEPADPAEAPPSGDGVEPVQITPRTDDTLAPDEEPVVSSNASGALPPAFPLPDLAGQGPSDRDEREPSEGDDGFTG